MIYNAFNSYFLFTCQVNCQGDLVVYFTMLTLGQTYQNNPTLQFACFVSILLKLLSFEFPQMFQAKSYIFI
jgi:hypothetical protein